MPAPTLALEKLALLAYWKDGLAIVEWSGIDDDELLYCWPGEKEGRGRHVTSCSLYSYLTSHLTPLPAFPFYYKTFHSAACLEKARRHIEPAVTFLRTRHWARGMSSFTYRGTDAMCWKRHQLVEGKEEEESLWKRTQAQKRHSIWCEGEGKHCISSPPLRRI